jgi:hypothetical protein
VVVVASVAAAPTAVELGAGSGTTVLDEVVLGVEVVVVVEVGSLSLRISGTPRQRRSTDLPPSIECSSSAARVVALI